MQTEEINGFFNHQDTNISEFEVKIIRQQTSLHNLIHAQGKQKTTSYTCSHYTSLTDTSSALQRHFSSVFYTPKHKRHCEVCQWSNALLEQ